MASRSPLVAVVACVSLAIFSRTVSARNMRATLSDSSDDRASQTNDAGSPNNMVGVWRGSISFNTRRQPEYPDGDLFGLVSPNGRQMWLTKAKDTQALSTTDNTMLSWTAVNETASEVVFNALYLQRATGPQGRTVEGSVCQIEVFRQDRWDFHGKFGQSCDFGPDDADFMGYRILMSEVMPPLASRADSNPDGDQPESELPVSAL
mmetsp:Transcript_1451/g.4203  ORF Transcript_1451/g.4203 Transcript_1451/m.4203 type:complete len:206 (+) Transcript_1451:342-959(+)|eukprot:CAMPEP_0117652938 /NCGR_PEP_ID=MMETSP0804-20121206/2915_1 /TAXON_ID=1074897 /ORGANISM="Tetraselmis astigmatica, Strain CCMP880" /LENGTH=205 /DNA_ID=CAMNT_0005459061 /DNA_START=240 /DNA_END=857 /DNA_ORIENTATION=-